MHPNIGASGATRKGYVSRNRRTDIVEVRGRLVSRLAGRSARWLAGETGYSEKNVQRYVSGESSTIPADFIGSCEEAGFASARWLLLGEGSPDPIQATTAETVLGEIQRLTSDPAAAADEISRRRTSHADDARQVSEDLARRQAILSAESSTAARSDPTKAKSTG